MSRSVTGGYPITEAPKGLLPPATQSLRAVAPPHMHTYAHICTHMHTCAQHPQTPSAAHPAATRGSTHICVFTFASFRGHTCRRRKNRRQFKVNRTLSGMQFFCRCFRFGVFGPSLRAPLQRMHLPSRRPNLKPFLGKMRLSCVVDLAIPEAVVQRKTKPPRSTIRNPAP